MPPLPEGTAGADRNSGCDLGRSTARSAQASTSAIAQVRHVEVGGAGEVVVIDEVVDLIEAKRLAIAVVHRPGVSQGIAIGALRKRVPGVLVDDRLARDTPSSRPSHTPARR